MVRSLEIRLYAAHTHTHIYIYSSFCPFSPFSCFLFPAVFVGASRVSASHFPCSELRNENRFFPSRARAHALSLSPSLRHLSSFSFSFAFVFSSNHMCAFVMCSSRRIHILKSHEHTHMPTYEAFSTTDHVVVVVRVSMNTSSFVADFRFSNVIDLGVHRRALSA